MGVEKPPFRGALVSGILALLAGTIAMATQHWTSTDEVSIGLWGLTDNGEYYSWTDTWEYSEDFFYATWMGAVRGLMMAAIILGAFAICYNCYVLWKHESSMVAGNFLLTYYTLTGCLLLIAGAVYCAMIPQPIYTGDTITSYLYRGDYGYSLWMCWVAGGLFLPAGALSYEGGNQARKHSTAKQLLLSNEGKSNDAFATS